MSRLIKILFVLLAFGYSIGSAAQSESSGLTELPFVNGNNSGFASRGQGGEGLARQYSSYNDVITDVGMNKYLNADGTISATNHPNTELIMDEAINNTATKWGGRSDMVYPTISSISRPAGYDTDADGMPNIWETSMGFNPDVKDDSLDYDNDGYTNIEEYLNMIDK